MAFDSPLPRHLHNGQGIAEALELQAALLDEVVTVRARQRRLADEDFSACGCRRYPRSPMHAAPRIGPDPAAGLVRMNPDPHLRREAGHAPVLC